MEEVSPGRSRSYSDFKERPQTTDCRSGSCSEHTCVPARRLVVACQTFHGLNTPEEFLLAFFAGVRMERASPSPSPWICGYAKYASQLCALTCGRKTSCTDVGVFKEGGKKKFPDTAGILTGFLSFQRTHFSTSAGSQLDFSNQMSF